MKNLSLFLLVTALTFAYPSYSQEKNHQKTINNDVWKHFTKAFETYDYQLFSSIHSQELIRVTGDNKGIKRFGEYIEGYKKRWKTATRKQTISFRFLERIANDQNGSERGIYRLTINPNTDNTQHYYGKFHVILAKENNVWKILLDYDSSENKSIDEASYQNAFPIDAFDRY